MGTDPIFQKGSTAYNRFYGDLDVQPNVCVAPIVEPPYYAVKIVVGDLGTYAGITGGAYPGPGITLGPAMTFGWLAARHLANS